MNSALRSDIFPVGSRILTEPLTESSQNLNITCSSCYKYLSQVGNYAIPIVYIIIQFLIFFSDQLRKKIKFLVISISIYIIKYKIRVYVRPFLASPELLTVSTWNQQNIVRKNISRLTLLFSTDILNFNFNSINLINT